MKKMICVVIGMAFMLMGILGLTGLVKAFQYYPIYLNIGEIVIGLVVFLFGVYAKQKSLNSTKKIMADQQGNEINEQKEKIDEQEKEIEQQENEMVQQRKEPDPR